MKRTWVIVLVLFAAVGAAQAQFGGPGESCGLDIPGCCKVEPVACGPATACSCMSICGDQIHVCDCECIGPGGITPGSPRAPGIMRQRSLDTPGVEFRLGGEATLLDMLSMIERRTGQVFTIDVSVRDLPVEPGIYAGTLGEVVDRICERAGARFGLRGGDPIVVQGTNGPDPMPTRSPGPGRTVIWWRQPKRPANEEGWGLPGPRG